MKDKPRFSAYKKYAENLIVKSVRDEKLLIKAREMVKAKDEKGVNLFWNEQEEIYMRRLLENFETIRHC